MDEGRVLRAGVGVRLPNHATMAVYLTTSRWSRRGGERGTEGACLSCKTRKAGRGAEGKETQRSYDKRRGRARSGLEVKEKPSRCGEVMEREKRERFRESADGQSVNGAGQADGSTGQSHGAGVTGGRTRPATAAEAAR